MNFWADDQEFAHFTIRVNGDILCYGDADMTSSGSDDNGEPSCAGVVTLNEGMVEEKLQLFYMDEPIRSVDANCRSVIAPDLINMHEYP